MTRLRGARSGGFLCSRSWNKRVVYARRAQVFIGSYTKKEWYGAAGRMKGNEVRPGTLHALHQPRVVGLKLLEKYFFFLQNPKKRRKKQRSAARDSLKAVAAGDALEALLSKMRGLFYLLCWSILQINSVGLYACSALGKR